MISDLSSDTNKQLEILKMEYNLGGVVFSIRAYCSDHQNIMRILGPKKKPGKPPDQFKYRPWILHLYRILGACCGRVEVTQPQLRDDSRASSRARGLQLGLHAV